MAANERSVTRREPIVVTVDDKLVFEAKPLPWRKRNDLGNHVTQSFSDTLNGLVSSSQASEDAPMALVVKTFEDTFDYAGVFALGYPGTKDSLLDTLDFDEMIAVLSAALEVNGLERLVYMLDPDRKKGPTIGESAPSIEATTDDGAKTE